MRLTVCVICSLLSYLIEPLSDIYSIHATLYFVEVYDEILCQSLGLSFVTRLHGKGLFQPFEYKDV